MSLEYYDDLARRIQEDTPKLRSRLDLISWSSSLYRYFQHWDMELAEGVYQTMHHQAKEKVLRKVIAHAIRYEVKDVCGEPFYMYRGHLSRATIEETEPYKILERLQQGLDFQGVFMEKQDGFRKITKGDEVNIPSNKATLKSQLTFLMNTVTDMARIDPTQVHNWQHILPLFRFAQLSIQEWAMLPHKHIRAFEALHMKFLDKEYKLRDTPTWIGILEAIRNECENLLFNVEEKTKVRRSSNYKCKTCNRRHKGVCFGKGCLHCGKEYATHRARDCKGKCKVCHLTTEEHNHKGKRCDKT